MKPSTRRATSTTKTATSASNATTSATTARERVSLVKSSTMSPEPSQQISTPRRSSTIPTRQSATASRGSASSGSRGASPKSSSRGVSPPIGSPLNGNGVGSPNHGGSRAATSRKQSPTPAIGPHQRSKQILNHDFLSKAPKSRGPSMLARSIDDPSTIQQALRRHTAPSSKLQEYMAKSHDHGSLASYSNFRSSSQDRGPIFLSKSQNQGPRSLSKSQDRGFMSRSQDRGSLTSYAKFQSTGPWKVTVPEYGNDGRRLSSGSRDQPVAQSSRLSTAMQAALRRDGVSLHLQMGRSVDSTVSLSTTASSPTDRGRGRQSFRDSSERRLSPLQSSDPVTAQGYRSGDLTPEETSPLDARAPASAMRGWAKHRQLKSPDFFDVKKLDGDCGVITAVSRMHNKANGGGQRISEEDHEGDVLKPLNSEAYYEKRRETLAGSARKAFSGELDSAVGSAHFSEINYQLDKELNGANDLLEIGSWNDDDEEYLRIYKHDRSPEGPFVDILEDTSTESQAASKSNHNHNHVQGTNPSPGRKKWDQFSKVSDVSHLYGGGMYQKSEAGSDLGTSTQPSPQASPPSGLADRATSATTAAVSRISSTAATSIDLNRSTDTTCSTYSQYDNAFWGDPPVNGSFRPWNPKREAEMTLAVVAARPLPEACAPSQDSPVLETRESAANDALDATRMLKYNDGLEKLTSYMKTASQTARKKRGLSDDVSSQASGCFDYLVDFLESQTSITDVLVSAHDETRKIDFANSAAGAAANKTDFANSLAMKRLDSKLTNDTSVMSNRSIESRITDLGSEASWESGKSRSVQTLGTTGKVMDQITEKVDSLSYDSPKHLSTFKFGLKKTTVGAFETITSSEDQLGLESKPDAFSRQDLSAPSSRAMSERSFPHHTHSTHISTPHSPNSSWRSQTAPNSHKSSRNPSRSPLHRIYADEIKLLSIDHRLSSPSPLSPRQINVVCEGGVESRREEETKPGAEVATKAREAKHSKEKKPQASSVDSMEKNLQGSASPTVEAPVKDMQMHTREPSSEEKSQVRSGEDHAPRGGGIGRGVVKHDDRDSLSHHLNQANKGCGCNIL